MVNMLTVDQDASAIQELDELGVNPLITIRTVFPFRLFPCIITLDREKVTISDYIFFFTKQVENVFIKDMISVRTTENLFFANVTFVSGMWQNRKISNSYFWKEDAERFRKICEGLRTADKEKIDIMKISRQELIPRLEELGDSAA
jgi:hypothetical protein